MSEYNSILTDKEIRDLLKQYIVGQEENNVLTEQLIEMEAKIAFGTVPAAALAMPRESEMIGKLAKGVTAKTGLYTWVIGFTAVAATGLGLYVYNKPAQTQSKPVHEIPAAPVNKNIVPASPINAAQPPIASNTLPPVWPAKSIAMVADSPGVVAPPFPPEPPVAPVPPAPPIPPVPPINPTSDMATFDGNNPGAGAYHTKIDTSFTGIHKIVVVAVIGNINVGSDKSDIVHVNGEIKMNGRNKDKTPPYRIRHERKGDLLQLWIEKDNSKKYIGKEKYDITAGLNLSVPKGIELDISNGSGNTSCEGVDAKKVKINNRYGNISLNSVNGPMDLAASSGDISLNSTSGNTDIDNTYGNANINTHKGSIAVSASSGNITVNTLTGDNVELKSTYGNVSISTIKARVIVKVASGDVLARDIQGSTNIQGSYGNINVKGLTGNLDAASSSGDVLIQDVKGDMTVRSVYGNIQALSCSGKMDITAQSGDIYGKDVALRNALTINSVYGNVHMQFSNGLSELSFDLTAKSGEISVHKDGTNYTGDKGRLLIDKGKINVKVVTTSGDQLYE